MYRTEINELANGRFQVCIYNSRNKLIFSRIRRSYDEARTEQVTFMYLGPDSEKKRVPQRRKKAGTGGPTGAPLEVARYLFGE